jgi:CheY-like chemotaxis protein
VKEALLGEAPAKSERWRTPAHDGATTVSEKDRLVVLVEDDPDHALLAGRTFRKAGLSQPLVFEGPEVLSYLGGEGEYADREKHPLPDLVISDLHAGLIGAGDLLQFVRARSELSSVPVAVLSGSSNPRDEEDTRELGAVAFLQKPLTADALRGLMRAVGLDDSGPVPTV